MKFSGYLTAKNYNLLRKRLAPAMLAGIALLFATHSARTEDNDEHKGAAITDCGTVISQPGRYFLANDLKECPDFGISIAANSVKVELRGHTIQGTLGNNAINAKGGATGLSEIEIEGPGIVTGGLAGIHFGNVHHSRVHGLVLVRNNFGLTVNAGDFTSDATIQATASTENDVQDNIITGNTFQGIAVNDGNENRFLHNNLSGNGSQGLSFFNAENNVARDNAADVNGGSGIDAGALGAGNQVEHNIALGNGRPDLKDENGDCTRNTWTGNSFASNSPVCIR